MNDDLAPIKKKQAIFNTKLVDMDERVSQLEAKCVQQDTFIREQYERSDEQDEKIKELIDKNKKLEDFCSKQLTHNSKVNSMCRDLDDKIDELDQYGRRNMCRISGIPESREDTTDLVVDLAVNKLKLNIKKEDIDRSHRLGPLNPTAKTPRSIVVKFNTWSKRKELYDARRDLKNTGVYINDHLTQTRSTIMHTARRYKREKMIKNAWTSDGKMLCSDPDDNIHVILSAESLKKFGELPVPLAAAPEAEAPTPAHLAVD